MTDEYDTPRADAVTAVYRLLVRQSRDHEDRHANAAEIVDAVVTALDRPQPIMGGSGA